MCIHKVVHSFYVVSCFYVDHLSIFMKKVHPFLRVPVILNEILPDKSIPAIALVQVQSFVKAGLYVCIGGQMFFEKLPDARFVFFISRMSVLHVPTVEL